MKIMEKIKNKSADLFGQPAVTLAFLGDSVTQGCFDVTCPAPGVIDTVFDAEKAYHTHLRKLLNALYPRVPINIINAGISGGTAGNGADRLERDVLRHSPDLCVVCFGLNDCCVPAEDAPQAYRAALTNIFTRLQAQGIEVIFMTPNMMCTTVDPSFENETLKQVASNIVTAQTTGRLELFLNIAKDVAKEKHIPVCDCYARWQKLAACGVDTNALLSNKINHPTGEMNKLFAISLLETMMEQE